MTDLENERSLRLLWFGQSVISDWNNPIAATVRVTMRALQNAGHMVTFLEPRNSPPFVAALAARGWAPYREFQAQFHDLHYRTYDMPRRAERDVWLSREAALVDAVIVQSDAPVEIFEWLERLDDAPMLRVLIKLTPEFPVLDAFDIVLAPDSAVDDYRFGDVESISDAHGQMTRLVRMIEARRPPAKHARPQIE